MASGPQHRHRNQFGQVLEPGSPEYEAFEMTESVTVTEHNVVNPVSTDANGDVVTDSSGNPAGNVQIESTTTAVNGNPGLYPVDANAAAGSGDGATEFITNAIGYKGFTVDIVDDVAIAVNESLMVTYSTAVSDQVNNTNILDSLRTNLGTPNAVNHPNSFIVTANTKKIPAPMMQDGVRIKTISVAAQAGDKDIVISTIE